MDVEVVVPPVPLDRHVSTGAPIEHTLALARYLKVHEFGIVLIQLLHRPLTGRVHGRERKLSAKRRDTSSHRELKRKHFHHKSLIYRD